MGELDVGAADDADALDDVVGPLLEALLELVADGEHGCGAEGVAGVDADGVDVLDEADGDHLAGGVADDLELELLPSEERLLDEDLMDEGGLESACGDGSEFLDVVAEAAAGAAHGVGGSDDDGEADFLGDGLGALDGVCDLAACHVDAEAVHGLLEGVAVLAALDGVDLDADDLDAIAVEDAFGGEFGGEVECGLSAEVGEECVRALLLDDLDHALEVEGLDVGDIGGAGVGHDGGRVGVDQDNLVSEAAQRLAGLGARIVKLAGLADDDRSGADDHDLLDVVAFRHGCLLGKTGRGWDGGSPVWDDA